MVEERGENHCAIGSKKVEQDMAHENWQTDLIEIPEIRTFRYLDKEPAEEERVERDQQDGMGKVAMVLKIELVIEEAEDKIGIGKEPHRQSGNSPPLSDFLIIDGPGNDSAGEGMGDAVHIKILTLQRPHRQIVIALPGQPFPPSKRYGESNWIRRTFIAIYD